jgi:3-oxoacyl-[acyl-carrier protein] reductase
MTGRRELDGRVALVTGSARNIGRAIALDLAAAGAKVVVNARSSRAECETVVAQIAAGGGEAMVAMADVADEGDVARMIDAIGQRFGRLDVLVNNAAVRRESAFADLTFREWREVLGVILDAAYLCAHAALPWLLASGQGAVVNIGGMSAHTGARHRAHVVAAKTGLVGFTRGLAHDLARENVTVNCVVPGMIATQRGRSAAEKPDHHKDHAPLVGRRGEPDEIARLVRFLSGPDARYITGQTIHANGGVFMP